jgi:hypothetical protein
VLVSIATETADSPHIDRESLKLLVRPGGGEVGVVLVEAGTHAGEGSGLDDALDAACRDKYGRSSSAVARITADVSRATTLRVDPS